MESVKKTVSKYKCNTPFPSTRQRTVRREQPVNRSIRRRTISAKDTDRTCMDITRKTWQIYSCSPLYHFDSDKSSLKRYSRLLSATLTAHGRRGMGISTDEQETGTKAVFTVAMGLAVLSDEPDAIKLTINTNEGKSVAEFYFCSVEAEPVIKDMAEIPVKRKGRKQRLADQFTTLPLFLCKGNLTTRKHVFNWLKTEFDCNIRKIEFSCLSLTWMLAMWANISLKQKKSKSTKISWKIPVPDIGINTIETSFTAESISKLWTNVHPSGSDLISVEEVENFIGGIEDHLTQHFKIKFQVKYNYLVGIFKYF
ncbi:unnamed protein product [Clavelina lepadiformis]|uniref:Centromere protein L n=1 Tax=Clavelina lepadiformis TaxID=159417 RepID=A0ABP0GX34_CLALP